MNKKNYFGECKPEMATLIPGVITQELSTKSKLNMPDFKFKLPAITELTPTQSLAYSPLQSILITGGPGSGKTVVTIFRFLRPIRESKEVMLFTYNRTLMASIRGTLKEKAEELFGELDETQIDTVISNNVASFYKWHNNNIGWFSSQQNASTVGDNFQFFLNRRRNSHKYAELFFDEAQDLTPAVFASAFILADKVSCGADNAQDLQGNFPPDQAAEIIFNNLNSQHPTLSQYLDHNFRNTKEIFEFARKFVPTDDRVQEIDASELLNGENPEVIQFQSNTAQMEYMLRLIENFPNSNIGILVHFSNQVEDVKKFLESNGFSCQSDAASERSFSYYYNGMNSIDENLTMKHLKTPFILTFDSCKGLEFDIVILPFFETSDTALAKQKRKKNLDGSYTYEVNADGTPKMWATRNHYYVACTRARGSLFILHNYRPKVLNFIDGDLPF